MQHQTIQKKRQKNFGRLSCGFFILNTFTLPLHFNWYLHLQFLMKMIYLFAASGYRSYANYSRLYLHETLILSDTNRWLNKQLGDGYHAVRRSIRF